MSESTFASLTTGKTAGAWSERVVPILLMGNGCVLGNKPIIASSPIPFKKASCALTMADSLFTQQNLQVQRLKASPERKGNGAARV